MVWRQGQSYSEDLRARVLAAVDGGMAARSAARLFRVSVSYIYKALIRRRRTGEVSASARRGHRPRKLNPAQEAALAAHIEAHPDLTLAALQGWLLAEHGVRLSNGAMWSAVARLGLSFKKRMGRPIRKWLVRGDLTGLRKRIRSRSCCPGQDGGPRALVLIRHPASMRRFFNQDCRAPVQPSGHLAFTARRFQRLPRRIDAWGNLALRGDGPGVGRGIVRR